MEISKILGVIVVIIVLYTVEVKAQGNPQLMECVQKLMPCQPYLHTVNPHPPPSCCGPLKEIVEKDAPCLCAVFNNPAILKTFNLTTENALELPKACGANPDVSLCAKNATSPPTPGQGTTKSKGSSIAPTISFNRFIFLSAFVAIFFF